MIYWSYYKFGVRKDLTKLCNGEFKDNSECDLN